MTLSRCTVGAAAALVVWAAALAAGQKASTPAELDKVMKRAGPAMREIQKALKSAAPPVASDVRAQMAVVRRSVEDSAEFWIERKKEDAVKMNREALAKIDAFEKAVTADPVDRATAMGALREVDVACRACHKVYRDTDEDNNYIIKPGTIGE